MVVTCLHPLSYDASVSSSIRSLNKLSLRSPNIDALSAELLFSMTDRLAPECIMALSLANSALRHSLQDVVKPLQENRTNKQQLLLLLEIDSPDLLACFTCNKLYKWRTAYNYACPKYSSATHPHPLRLNDEQYCRIHPAVFDLIFRARQLGPKYGLPLSCLKSRGWQSSRNKSGVDIYRESRARISRHRMILCSKARAHIHTGKNVEEQIAPLQNSLCGHMSAQVNRAVCDSQTEIQKMLNSKDKKCKLIGTNEWNCGECATDMIIQVSFVNNKKSQFKLTITTLHKFLARCPKRLVPQIKIQNHSGIQRAIPIPNLTVDRYLWSQYNDWGMEFTGCFTDVMQIIGRKVFRQHVKPVNYDPQNLDPNKIYFWICF